MIYHITSGAPVRMGRNGKPLTCSTIGKWLNELWSVHEIVDYANIKNMFSKYIGRCLQWNVNVYTCCIYAVLGYILYNT